MCVKFKQISTNTLGNYFQIILKSFESRYTEKCNIDPCFKSNSYRNYTIKTF